MKTSICLKWLLSNSFHPSLDNRSQPIVPSRVPFSAMYQLLLILLAFCLLFTGCSRDGSTQANANAQADAPLPPVVATVNGRAISNKLFAMYLKNGRESLGIDPATEEGRRQLEQLKEGIVSELLDRALIAQEAERRGLKVAPDKLSQAVSRHIAQLGGDQMYDAYLTEHQFTRDEYRPVIEGTVYGELLRDELSKDLKVSDDEVRVYLEKNQTDRAFQKPERVTASHILVAARPNLISQQLQKDKNLNGEALAKAVQIEMDARRRRAEELRRKAQAGADFAALARANSDDPGTKARGGDLGAFTKDTHTRAFDEAAFALKPGEISPIVQTDFGFHVIKVTAREAARSATLAEAAPEIRRRLLAERQAQTLNDWLKDARRKAAIKLNEPYRFGELRKEFPAM